MQPVSRYDPMDPAVREDPYEFYRALREQAPVHYDEGLDAHLVSRYADVKAVISNPADFSSKIGPVTRPPPPQAIAILMKAIPPVNTLLTADPPEHIRYRGLVGRAFAPRRVAKLEEMIRGIANSLVDDFGAEGRVDLTERFAVPLPLTIISDQLGVPRKDLPRLKMWSDHNVSFLGGMLDDDGFLEAAQGVVDFGHYFAERIEECRAAPRDDILSQLIAARLEGEEPLDVREMVSILSQFMVAGNETTTNAITAGASFLLRDPEALARVRGDLSLIPNMVEEVVRLESPVATLFRITTREVELAGTRLPAGARVAVMYASANRDPAVFPDPDRFDPARANAGDQLGFGFGEHYCVGAGLARKELAVAFETLVTRLPGLRLASGNDFAHHPSFILRGMKRLDVEFEAA